METERIGERTMKDINPLNDPEYRFYHKAEMARIMPFKTERARYGIEVIDYNELRGKNEATIVEVTRHKLNWDRLMKLIDAVPDIGHVDRSRRKKTLQPKDRLHFEVRGRGICYVCSSVYHYGSCNVHAYTQIDYKHSHLHHIIPNGDTVDGNIVTLCTHCHQIVHQVLFKSGKWSYGRPL
jgi:hypothetical protein